MTILNMKCGRPKNNKNAGQEYLKKTWSKSRLLLPMLLLLLLLLLITIGETNFHLFSGKHKYLCPKKKHKIQTQK